MVNGNIFVISTKEKDFKARNIAISEQAYAIFRDALGRERFSEDYSAYGVTLEECFRVLNNIAYFAYSENRKDFQIMEDLSENSWINNQHCDFDEALGLIIRAIAYAALNNNGAPIVVYWE